MLKDNPNLYNEALQYVQEAADIFKETGSRHLPEAEATLEEIGVKKGRR